MTASGGRRGVETSLGLAGGFYAFALDIAHRPRLLMPSSERRQALPHADRQVCFSTVTAPTELPPKSGFLRPRTLCPPLNLDTSPHGAQDFSPLEGCLTAKAKFTQADISRAIKGAQSVGLSPTRLEIDPTGRIILFFGDENVSNGPPLEYYINRTPLKRRNVRSNPWVDDDA